MSDLLTPFLAAGQLVRWKREQQGVSLRAFSDKCYLSPSAVSQIERGHIRPTFLTAHLIVVALKFSASERLRLRKCWEKPDEEAFLKWRGL